MNPTTLTNILMKFKFLLLIIIFFSAGETFAQLGISKFSIGYSQWNRTYDGSDEQVFFSTSYYPEVDFKQKAGMPTISGELQLYKGLGLEGRLGLWKHTFQKDFKFQDDDITESITQRIIPASLNLVFNTEVTPWLSLYAGAGMNRYFLQETSERKVSPGTGSISPQTFTGNNYGWNNKLGAEFWFSGNFGLAIEGRYHFGKYNKSLVPGAGEAPVSYSIDLSGLEIGASLKYRLAPRSKKSKVSAAEPVSVAPVSKNQEEKQEGSQVLIGTPVQPAPSKIEVKQEVLESSEAINETPAPDAAAAPVSNQPAAARPVESTAASQPRSAAVIKNDGDPIPLNQTPISSAYPQPSSNQVPSLLKGAQTRFVMGSEKLGQNELSMMEETVMFLKNFPQYNVIIYGHACDIGTPERNYIISLKRADEARTLLIRRGIEAGRIAIVGMGSDQPKVPNTSEENRMINRRIEVYKFIAR